MAFIKDYAVYKFPFGWLQVEYVGGTVISLDKLDEERSGGHKTALTDRVFSQITEYLQGKRRSFDFPFQMEGTPFQKKVWNALQNIPYGETRTYKQIAEEIGNPKACRAVGMANNKNPMIIVVPCHRVIGANGKLVGYGGGLEMKRALLDLESKPLRKSKNSSPENS
ncbi:methylated-DNA--[protein]-cysteine S-methyltransferase [Porcincola intestinalis]|uniref:methylated-DNA--[protein]-cysteine S-methyltransferase n=1 Tax=Porcincola intestinalis TaxID=2606632 RepID=UPI0012B2C7CB